MKHLTKEQRYTISAMINNGFSQKEIAKTIEKDKSTVSRELKRNCSGRSRKYRSELAQQKCEQRHKLKHKKHRFTEPVKQYVNYWLSEDYSPEQIAGRAKRDGIDCVSTERIYQYIWHDKKNKGRLHLYLRRKGRKYRKRGSAKDSRGIIKDRVDISKRPAIVAEKVRLGDLEIDTIIGKNHKGAILTVNDRVSGYLWMSKLNGKNAEELSLKAVELLSPNKHWLHTITGDNGKEFAEHKTIAKGIEVDFFFAQPYHSWERGANENTNGLVRQYIPKGTSFESITNKNIMYVQHKLNNRPRKKLGFLSPIEFLSLSLSNQKVAFMT